MFSIKWLIALYCSLYLKEKQNKSRCFCKRLAKVEISSTSVAANIVCIARTFGQLILAYERNHYLLFLIVLCLFHLFFSADRAAIVLISQS